MGKFTGFHRILGLLLMGAFGLLPTLIPISGYGDGDSELWESRPFEFNPTTPTLAPPADAKSDTTLRDYAKDQDKITEIQSVTPEGQTRSYYFPHIAGSHLAEHTLSLGPGLVSNPSLTSRGQSSWTWLMETKHLIVPRFGALDTAKWGLILGSQWQLSQRGEDMDAHLRAKIPTELMLSDAFQFRFLGMVDLERRARWDEQADLPFFESQTLYGVMSSQIYLQYRLASWIEIRVGAPLSWRQPLTTPQDFLGQALAQSAGFTEVGPALFLNFPLASTARIKFGGAYLTRTYSEFPVISQAPLTTDTPLSQNYIRALGRVDLQPDEDLTLNLLVRYHLFDGTLAAYDFSVPEVSASAQWRAGSFWIIPKVGYWLRTYPSLTYPVDPTDGVFSGLSSLGKQESLLSWALQLIHEIEFQNFESLYLTVSMGSQTFSNSYPETAPNTYEAVANATSLDILMGFGFFL